MSVACEAPPVAEEANRVRRRGQKFQGARRRNFWEPQEETFAAANVRGRPKFLWRVPPSLSAERDGGTYSTEAQKAALKLNIRRIAAGRRCLIFRCAKNRRALADPHTQKKKPPMAVFLLAGAQGLEPWTRGFGDRCSTN